MRINSQTMKVSIHAPARGATRRRVDARETADEFQSTLPRGERPAVRCTQYGPRTFQSTLPRGERRQEAAAILARRDVSIHAPARGATRRADAPLAIGQGVSIHAPARGATSLACGLRICSRFQSTLPRGERHSGGLLAYRIFGGFNPRSREGRDTFAGTLW